MRRLRNWDVGLTSWAATQVGKPFEWGLSDCASLVRRSLQVMYGFDLFPAIERWSSLLGARKAVEAYGSVPEQLFHLGAIELPMAYASQGDIVYHPFSTPAGFTGSSFVLVSGRLLSANPDGPVTLFPRAGLEPGAVLYRVPG